MYVAYKGVIVLTCLTAGDLASQLKFHSKQYFCLVLCTPGKLTGGREELGENCFGLKRFMVLFNGESGYFTKREHNY